MGTRLRVLHVLPHAGGGMGAVLRALLAAEARGGGPYVHAVASLEYLNEPTRRCCDALAVAWADELALRPRGELDTLVASADLVLMHWWNHPYMTRLLFEGLPPSRLLLWSHVNGYWDPQSFLPELFDTADLFVFATKASLGAPAVKRLAPGISGKFRVIRSCAGIPEGAGEPCPKVGPYQIGYVGTVDPAKMCSHFLQICAAVDLTTPCVVAGGPGHDALRKTAEGLGIAERFEVLGPVDDPKPLFRRFHAFAYPLNPSHYGTGEQVLVEAMAFGAVPVVLANPPERELVRHGETGLVAEGFGEFAAALRFLADHSAERDRMAMAGYRYVMENCGIDRSKDQFHALFAELAALPKCPHRLSLPGIDGVTPGSPFHLFLSSSAGAPERDAALAIAAGRRWREVPQSFRCGTRGSPAHYLRLLGNDTCLERICAVTAQMS